MSEFLPEYVVVKLSGNIFKIINLYLLSHSYFSLTLPTVYFNKKSLSGEPLCIKKPLEETSGLNVEQENLGTPIDRNFVKHVQMVTAE